MLRQADMKMSFDAGDQLDALGTDVLTIFPGQSWWRGVSRGETERLTRELGAILGYVETLSRVDTTEVPPTIEKQTKFTEEQTEKSKNCTREAEAKKPGTRRKNTAQGFEIGIRKIASPQAGVKHRARRTGRRLYN